jgi:Tol biopolymer transport system component/predicted Ser/Thr protein kinase
MIGAGGMGEVYSAHDSELDREVAIKLLPHEFTDDAERKSRFRQEARTVSALNHPNIITIYEIGENEHGSFLATEFIEGRTLRELIKSETLSLTRILRIVEQVAHALSAAHQANIVHRDIKPDNIMVRRDSIVKVLDFGLAKPSAGVGSDEDFKQNKTVPGTVMGSARYMSPEQARGMQADERTDIWSLGVVLYEMLAGTAPFNGKTAADTIAAVIYHEPEPVWKLMPNVPVELQRILRKSLQKDREERYQSVKDFALDIKDVLYDLEHADSGGHAGHVSSSPNFSEEPTMLHHTLSANHPTDKTNVYTSDLSHIVKPDRQQRRWPAALAAAAAMLLIGVIGYGLYRWYDTEAPLVAAAFDKPQLSRINTDGKVAFPALSPDGKYVAYLSGEAGNRSLVVRQVATDSTVTVVPASSLNLQFPVFSPDGDYVYYTQTRSDFVVSTLYRVPTLGGTPKKLIEDVDSGVAFSPDGKQFAFVRHATNTNSDNIFIAKTDTLAAEPLLSSSETDYDFFIRKVAWSPNGQTLLIGAGKRQSGFLSHTDIAEVSVESKSIKPVNTEEFFAIGTYVWFADGSGFLFTARETENSPAQIWRASYPQFEAQQITNDINDYVDLGISADGRNLITLKGDTSGSIWRFNTASKASQQLTTESRNIEGGGGIIERPNGQLIFTRSEAKESSIWTSDADGKNSRLLVADKGYSIAPVASPDGRYIVFNRHKDKSSRIWRANADGSNPVQLSTEQADSADNSPQITSDGRTVIFQRQITNSELSTLMKVPIEGGPVELFHAGENLSIFQPKVSPDGTRIAYITYDVNSFEKKIQIATLSGGSFGTVERDLEYNLIERFYWSPDSKSLTVLTNRGGMPNLWRQPVDGSAASPITDFKSGRIFNFAWAPDGKNLLIARGNTNNDLILIRDAARSAARESLTRTSKNRGALAGL